MSTKSSLWVGFRRSIEHGGDRDGTWKVGLTVGAWAGRSFDKRSDELTFGGDVLHLIGEDVELCKDYEPPVLGFDNPPCNPLPCPLVRF
jgi:hypothetical protein